MGFLRRALDAVKAIGHVFVPEPIYEKTPKTPKRKQPTLDDGYPSKIKINVKDKDFIAQYEEALLHGQEIEVISE